MVIHPCAHPFELRRDLDQPTTKLVGTDNSHNHCVRDRESGLYSLFGLSVTLNVQSQLIVIGIFLFCHERFKELPEGVWMVH